MSWRSEKVELETDRVDAVHGGDHAGRALGRYVSTWISRCGGLRSLEAPSAALFEVPFPCCLGMGVDAAPPKGVHLATARPPPVEREQPENCAA